MLFSPFIFLGTTFNNPPSRYSTIFFSLSESPPRQAVVDVVLNDVVGAVRGVGHLVGRRRSRRSRRSRSRHVCRGRAQDAAARLVVLGLVAPLLLQVGVVPEQLVST